jgi:predicted RND superfamily exporter protein
LRAAKARPRNRTGIWKSLEGFVTRKHPLIAAAVLVTALVLAPFAWRTNSDPDLPSYFSESGAVGQGLRAIDPSTGSSPLDVIVVNASGAPLDYRDSFERLMALHDALRENEEVGSALSIALLYGRNGPALVLFPVRLGKETQTTREAGARADRRCLHQR